MSVPSFSSFPQPKAGPSHPPEEKKKRSKRHKEKQKSHAPDRDFTPNERHEELSTAKFYKDLKGGTSARFGGNDLTEPPKYNLVTYHQVLGLQPGLSVVNRNNKGIEIALHRRNKDHSFSDSKTRRLLEQPPRSLSALLGHAKRDDETEDFIRVSNRARQPNTQPYNALNLLDSEESSSSSLSDSDSFESEEETLVLSSHQAMIKRLENELRDNPASIPAWLTLLSHSTSVVPLDSKNVMKVRADIALSVLSRAISAHPSNKTSVRLWLKYLRAGEEIWEDRKLSQEWEAALDIQSTEIWIAWLDWRISTSKDGINPVVEDANRALKGISSGDEVGQLTVQWRTAVSMCLAGYTERAMALFQCQAELTFEVPQSLYGLPLETLLESLENFWESEFPRIGEPDAKGWAAWERAECPEYSPSSTRQKSRSYASAISDPYQKWSVEEANADLFLDVPTRSTDDTDDPFSTILFSDFKPLLIALSSVEAKFAFRLIWLSFLRLHIPGFSESLARLPMESMNDRWCHTHLMTPHYLRSIFPLEVMQKRVIPESHAGVLVGSEKQYSSSFGPLQSWGHGAIHPFDGLVQHNRPLWTKQDLTGVNEDFVRNVFRQCRMGSQDLEWDTLAIAFEAALQPKSAIKMSRSLLAGDQDSLTRWGIHASLEWARGRIEDARKVYRTVLTSSSTTRKDTGLLWWRWAEMEWLTGQEALSVVMKSAGIDGTGGVSILRAKRALEERFPKTASKEQEAWIKLRVLLEILTSSLTVALSLLDEQLVMFDVGSASHESLSIASLAFAYHYGTTLRNSTPTAILQGRSYEALKYYPCNSFILGMFLESQRGQGVWGRVREQLGDMIVDGDIKDKSVIRRVMEVWIETGWEHGRWQFEKERVRAGLSNAVQHERTRGSAILWKIYIEFEILAGDLDRGKQLLFQAMRECPLVKELYLLGFGPLRSVLTSRELKGLAETMAERGLRVRRGLEEILEGIEDTDGTREREDDVGEADVEANAAELRRLRPY